MTSSLVGSEMCIRDREHSMQLPSCLGTVIVFVAKPLGGWRPIGLMSGLCLLYTSDAADDM
eukprot:2663615-Prorocentrum_lima.AAC.1